MVSRRDQRVTARRAFTARARHARSRTAHTAVDLVTIASEVHGHMAKHTHRHVRCGRRARRRHPTHKVARAYRVGRVRRKVVAVLTAGPPRRLMFQSLDSPVSLARRKASI